MNEEEYETQISAEYIYMLDKQQEEIEQLQNNWNELKKWLEDENNQKYSQYIYNYSINNWVLNKMQELEQGKDESN